MRHTKHADNKCDRPDVQLAIDLAQMQYNAPAAGHVIAQQQQLHSCNQIMINGLYVAFMPGPVAIGRRTASTDLNNSSNRFAVLLLLICLNALRCSKDCFLTHPPTSAR